MTRLTTHQEALIQSVRTKDEHYRQVRQSARAEAEIIIAEKIAAALLQRDTACRLAFDAGVPKKQIRERGLLTTAPVTLDEALKRVTASAPEAATVERFTVGDWHEFWPGEIRLVHVTMSGPDWDQWLEANRARFGVGYSESNTATAYFHPGTGLVETIENNRPSATAIWFPVDQWVKENAVEAVRVMSDQRNTETEKRTA